MNKRVIIIVLDSFGIGEAPDASAYGDEGSNTLRTVAGSPYFSMPNAVNMGLYAIDGVDLPGGPEHPTGSFARMREASSGKDTTIGHWEIAGLIKEQPFPVFPDGFPDEVIEKFEAETGRKVLCNRPCSGTEVIKDYGEEHMRTGALIVYTSADSVFQVAAHEDIVPVEELYGCCKIARNILVGEKYGVGRVIARPFIGEPGNFTRTSRRHDFSLEPPRATMPDRLKENGFEVIGVGKIFDIFAGRGITDFVRTVDNADGIEKTLEYMDRDFEGLLFTNLVDCDMVYGHRNDVDGYAKAMIRIDEKLPEIVAKMREEDVLILTADHGCDPGTSSTDHSREYTPLIIYGKPVLSDNNLGTRPCFADIGATVLDYFGLPIEIDGEPLPVWKN